MSAPLPLDDELRPDESRRQRNARVFAGGLGHHPDDLTREFTEKREPETAEEMKQARHAWRKAHGLNPEDY